MARATPPALPFPWPASGWEYQDISIEYDGSWSEALDELGKDGWMLVSLLHDESVKGDSEIRAVLMRPRAAASKAVAEGRVKKRGGRSETSETGHEEIVEEDDDGDGA